MTYSSIAKKKENYYILHSYHLDGKKVYNKPLQLILGTHEKKVDIPTDRLSQRYRVKGIILDRKDKDKRYVTPQIFKVSSIREARERIRAYSYLTNYTYVKLMVDSPMFGKVLAKKRQVDVDYITNIKVKADDKLIYNVNLSPCISKNPLVKFAYKDIKPNFLTVEYTDNNVTLGTVGIKTKKVKHRNKIKPIPESIKLSKNPKSYPNQIESIKKLFGDITLIEDGIELTAPKIAENGGSIPITIRSNIKFKSIALFMGVGDSPYYSEPPINIKNSNVLCGEGGYSFVSQWFSTPYSIANFNIRIRMRQSGEVLVVLEAEDGKFYMVKKDVDVSIAGGN